MRSSMANSMRQSCWLKSALAWTATSRAGSWPGRSSVEGSGSGSTAWRNATWRWASRRTRTAPARRSSRRPSTRLCRRTASMGRVSPRSTSHQGSSSVRVCVVLPRSKRPSRSPSTARSGGPPKSTLDCRTGRPSARLTPPAMTSTSARERIRRAPGSSMRTKRAAMGCGAAGVQRVTRWLRTMLPLPGARPGPPEGAPSSRSTSSRSPVTGGASSRSRVWSRSGLSPPTRTVAPSTWQVAPPVEVAEEMRAGAQDWSSAAWRSLRAASRTSAGRSRSCSSSRVARSASRRRRSPSVARFGTASRGRSSSLSRSTVWSNTA